MSSPRAPLPILKKYYRSESDREPFVTALFDGTARYYDRVCALGSLGSGAHYRRWALGRSGLRRGMTMLDVATGTGQIARAAEALVGAGGTVIGLDPSAGMLREARKTLAASLVQARVEALPFHEDRFDFLSMGYALRHVADLGVAFRECRRVLKPGGRLLILEISRPRSAVGLRLVRLYFARVLPVVMRLSTGSAQAGLLMRYFWDTIAECAPPETILDALRTNGFGDVTHVVRGGLLSEYAGVKPDR